MRLYILRSLIQETNGQLNTGTLVLILQLKFLDGISKFMRSCVYDFTGLENERDITRRVRCMPTWF